MKIEIDNKLSVILVKSLKTVQIYILIRKLF
jgi:hypothetical protein